jgi:hypothetical protein
MKAASGNMLRLGWLVLLLGLLVAMVRRHGDSPLLWIDTLNDDHLVRACLEHDECRTRGATVSFGTLVQGGSWHELRAAASSLGLSRTGLHRLLLVLDALSLLLIAVAASRRAGIGAAVLAMAAWLALDHGMETPGALLWNYRPILWLAAITTVLGLHLSRGAGTGAAALAGALAAILAGCHYLGLFLAGPLAILTLVSGPRRSLRAAVFVLASGAVLAATSLDSIRHNLGAISEIVGRAGPASETGSGAWALPWLLLMLSALALVLGPRERRTDVAALLLLALGPLLGASIAGCLSSRPVPLLYRAPALPALAIGVGSSLYNPSRTPRPGWSRANRRWHTVSPVPRR